MTKNSKRKRHNESDEESVIAVEESAETSQSACPNYSYKAARLPQRDMSALPDSALCLFPQQRQGRLLRREDDLISEKEDRMSSWLVDEWKCRSRHIEETGLAVEELNEALALQTGASGDPDDGKMPSPYHFRLIPVTTGAARKHLFPRVEDRRTTYVAHPRKLVRCDTQSNLSGEPSSGPLMSFLLSDQPISESLREAKRVNRAVKRSGKGRTTGKTSAGKSNVARVISKFVNPKKKDRRAAAAKSKVSSESGARTRQRVTRRRSSGATDYDEGADGSEFGEDGGEPDGQRSLLDDSGDEEEENSILDSDNDYNYTADDDRDDLDQSNGDS